MVGQVGQIPIQKRLKSGRTVTLLSLGTGGIRNNRRPFDNEEPGEYANRCAVQWHRVSVYPERLGEMAVKNIVPGYASVSSILLLFKLNLGLCHLFLCYLMLIIVCLKYSTR